MSTGFQGNGHDGETRQITSATAVDDGASTPAPTETLVSSAVGDRCVNCGATLSSDQRYCVVCGERRGAPRFTLPTATVTTTEVSSSSARAPRGSRFGSGTTLVAGVGTLLLALLVGFLIGDAATKNSKPVKAAAPVVKVVNTGGGSATPASSGTSTAASSSSTGKSASHSHKAKAATHKTVVTKKVVKAESSAASKVLGGHNIPPANTKLGQKCSGSSCNKPGYNKKSHKFDGSFFGQ